MLKRVPLAAEQVDLAVAGVEDGGDAALFRKGRKHDFVILDEVSADTFLTSAAYHITGPASSKVMRNCMIVDILRVSPGFTNSDYVELCTAKP